MPRASTSTCAAVDCQSGAGAAAAPRPLPPLLPLPLRQRAAAPAVGPAAQPASRSPLLAGAPGFGLPSTAAPAARASPVCAAYSRSSWRTAILNETDAAAETEAGSNNNTPVTSEGGRAGGATGSASHQHEAQQRGGAGADADGGSDGDEGEGGFGGTLTAAELRVKLMLAAGSGRLDLTDCRLQRLPPGVLELTELEELQLSGNRLAELPEGISRLTALRRLGLAGNLLTALPAGIGALTGLEGLWLHGNLLSALPQQMGGLGALRALSLAGNCLESVPAGSLAGLTALTDLTLAGNRLAALPLRELAPLVRLRKLALNGNRLSGVIPGQALGLGAHMTALTELMLQGNRLESVDTAVFECPSLQELSLADNLITHLPPTLSGASSLARLHLFGNRLTHLSRRQLASLPALATCWLEGNPHLAGEAVADLLALARSGAMPRLKAFGLDQTQLAAGAAAARSAGACAGAGSSPSGSGSDLPPLPSNVRVGCVLSSGPGYFKLQYGPQRPGAARGSPSSAAESSGNGDGSDGGVSSSNDLLVVAFGSAPGTPNWGGVLSKIYRAAAADEGRHFDVLYVADPARDWYGGGDDAVYGYYRERLSAYTRHYRRVLMLGDSMGATAALMFADLATGALAFCPQVDLTEASIRPGRPAAWLHKLRERLEGAVRASPACSCFPLARGELAVLVGTWQHDLAQANMLPAAGSGGKQDVVEAGAGRSGAGGRGALGSASRSWREAAVEGAPGAARAGAACGSVGVVAGSAAQRKPWAWEEQRRSEGGGDCGTVRAGVAGAEGGEAGSDAGSMWGGGGGVSVKVFSVDSHRLAAALDARGQLVPLVRDAVLHQLGLRSGNVRVANLL